MRGRRPTPTALKLLRGNPGKRKLPPAEPKPPTGPVERPKFLRGRAARFWDTYVPMLQKLGVFTKADPDMFAVWCQLMAEFQRDPRSFPAAKITQLRGLAATFGLEPSARARMGMNGNEAPSDPADAYLGSA
jgi:phage terminase small subunit